MASVAVPFGIDIEQAPSTFSQGRLPRIGPAAPIVEPPLYRLSIEQYEAMGKSRILDKHDHVELIDGFLLIKLDRSTLPPMNGSVLYGAQRQSASFLSSTTGVASDVETSPAVIPPVLSQDRLPRIGPAAPIVEPPLYRLSIEQYEAMAEAGILDEMDRVELVDGLLVKKMTKNGPHAVATGLALDVIVAILPKGWHVRKEDPARIPSRAGEPEPDLVIVRGSRRDYLERHPERTEVALVVEVSESSLDFDRSAKLRMYAGGGFPIYWILNVVDRQLEVHTEPSGDAEPVGYRQTTILKPGESVTFTIEGVDVGPIAVNDLLP